ncbi:MAG: T9SS type A sorting domain-containing protein [Bacteroidia bacterium]
MKKQLLIIMSFALFSGKSKAADSLEVRMKLKSINDILTFNQASTPANYLEYSWTVSIDSDNNIATGNLSGYDVALAVQHYKPPGGLPVTGTITSSSTQKNTWILDSTGASYGHAIRAFIDFTDSSLVMRGDVSFAELSNVSAGNHYMAWTLYYPGLETDTCASAIIPNIITDPAGDVTYGFIDIKQVNIIMPITSISEWSHNNFMVNIYPNPFTNLTTLELNSKYVSENAEYKIYDAMGKMVSTYKIKNRETIISRENLSPGVYFYQVVSESKIIGTGKLIVQ